MKAQTKLDFYYLRCDLTDRWPFSITRVELNGADPMLVYGLKNIEKWDSRIKFYYSKYDSMADFLISMACPLHFVTINFIHALKDDHLGFFRFIPISISPEGTGPEIKIYFIADYVFTLPALDINRSKIVYSSNRSKEIVTVTHAVIDPNKIPLNCHIFRLQEAPSNILVSQTIADCLKEVFITGLDLVRAELASDKSNRENF